MRRSKQGKKKESPPESFGGMDPELMTALISKIPPNAVTGRVELADIMKYMAQNPSDMDGLMASMTGLAVENEKVDLSTYDFAALAPTIVHESAWVIQLEHMGMVDESGHPVDDSTIHTTPGLRPSFMIYCYDDKGIYRATHPCDGLPTSSMLLRVLQEAIARPTPPIKPSLPWFLMLSIKFEQHAPDLKPFLDSLPAPFHWRVETKEEAQNLKEGIYELNADGCRKALVSADGFKASGNLAFGHKDRPAALKAYSSAISALTDVLTMAPDVKDEELAKKQLAICHANRAAAYLISGKGVDASKALEDGEAAEAVDPGYAKAYVRQSAAHQVLGNAELSKDVIARALRRPDLEDDNGLVDLIINLHTDGKGLSDDEETFKSWMVEILLNNRQSAKRLSGLKGGWKQRCDAQFAKWKR